MIRTPQNTQLEKYDDVDFTVHEYSNTSSSVRSEQNAVLRNGYNTIKAATAKVTEWKFPTAVIRHVGHQSRSSYMFGGIPPVIISEKERVDELKEWGSPVSKDEIVRLGDLEDFVTSNLLYIGQESNSPPAEPEPKTRKLNYSSLYHVIPQPHIHPSPYTASDSPPKVKPFKKNEPIFIAPYTMLPTSDVRLGWLIPIRGTFSWDHCTNAELLDSSSDLRCPPGSGSLNCVSWTEDSLLKFWDFLLSLRKIGSLGSLGVSFHLARSKDPPPASSVSTSRGAAETSLYSSRLNFCDYIKVYHDAPKALYVRYALDIWQYQRSSEGGQLQKIRLLKGARLALLDEASQGILTL
ncbi:hypothetical protein CPB84DRAFT_1746599 [Gymnopilus junonius]|uniref:Uncharacterized protein n=1 Tax=Gymnopilus junonius TaxID=109634 RepID=A0A9P5TN63_GYMJU|nr:hypothetical protein CPB84DRAFT_1746599 [Gymnopilus junonius]